MDGLEGCSDRAIVFRRYHRPKGLPAGASNVTAKYFRGCWTIPDPANQQGWSVGPLDRTELSPRARAGTPSNLISYRKCQLLLGSAPQLPGTAIAN